MIQAKPDKMAGLILTSVLKIENGKQTMSALELIGLTKTLKVRVIAFLGREIFLCYEEIKTIQALYLLFDVTLPLLWESDRYIDK